MRPSTATLPAPAHDTELDRVEWLASVPFVLVHLSTALGFVTGFRWEYLLLALGSYYVRMFFVTAGYHRYFAHRAFRTGRVFQFLLAFFAQTSAQKGALWWAANHRHHHRFSDAPEDVHSPARRGFWWSHVGWILARRWAETRPIRDFEQYPELVWLNRWPLMPAAALAVATFALGGLPGLVWGFLIPTVLLWHGTFAINSLTHIFGKRRYVTSDNSRNSFLLALVTCGEGWHNNHHFHQNTANQGWFWWELDLTYTVLKGLAWMRVVSHLRAPPEATRLAYRAYSAEQRARLREQTRFGAWRRPPSQPAPTPRPRSLVPATAER